MTSSVLEALAEIIKFVQVSALLQNYFNIYLFNNTRTKYVTKITKQKVRVRYIC